MSAAPARESKKPHEPTACLRFEATVRTDRTSFLPHAPIIGYAR